MKKIQKSNILRNYGLIIIFLAVVVILAIAAPTFRKPMNLLNVVKQASVNGILAFGMMIVVITAGIDLSTGSIVGFSGVCAALFAHPGEYPLIVPVMIGILTGLACGCVNGFLIARMDIPPFIATLGLMTSGRGVALLFSNGRPINDLSDSYLFLGAGYILGIPVPIVILIILAVVMYLLLNNTPFGRHVMAIGGNEQAARISGINVVAVKLGVYAIAGVLSAVAGILMSARISSGQPNLGVGYEMDAVASSVIGGVSLSGGIGTIWGTVCGALVIGIINNGMDLLGINTYWQQIVKGMIIVVAVLLDRLKNRKS